MWVTEQKERKGMDLYARLPSWGYLLRRGASEWGASHGGIQQRPCSGATVTDQTVTKTTAQPLNASPGKHRRLSGTGKSGMSSSSGTTSIRARSQWGPLAVCVAWAAMICLTPLRNSIDRFHRQSNGRRGVGLRLLLGTDNGSERKVLKMIVSLLGLSVEICGLNHIIIRKWSGAGRLFYALSTRRNMAAMFGYSDQTWRQGSHLEKLG